MKILFSPSEGKHEGGVKSTLQLKNLLFGTICKERQNILAIYQTLLTHQDPQKLTHLFGIKDKTKAISFAQSIDFDLLSPAIERYDGVAYDYLDYPSLSNEAKNYLNEHLIIYSNLFGPLRANDNIPFYKFKQGAKLEGESIEKTYQQLCLKLTNNYLQEEEILDLRASFYQKFYKPTLSYTTLKFLKNGKVVSHWAKAYRGFILRHLAQHQINAIKTLKEEKFDTIELDNIIVKRNHEELIYKVIA
jgi:cytoplasmic iron level regulating protein YaaA (DUF328/UPF0246 family)